MSKVTLVVIGICMLLALLKDQPKRSSFRPTSWDNNSPDTNPDNTPAQLLKALQSLIPDGEAGKEGLETVIDLVQRSVIDGTSGANLAAALTGLYKTEELDQTETAAMIQQILGDVHDQLEREDNHTASKVFVAKILTGLLALDCGAAKRADEVDLEQCDKNGICSIAKEK